jgi:DNA-binding FrmR family transcriptional regulator
MTVGTDEDRKRIANRLRRAQGQLGAVITAMETGADCRAIVTQLAAVSSALDRAGFAIVSTAMRDCVVEGDDAELTVDELEKLFLSLA